MDSNSKIPSGAIPLPPVLLWAFSVLPFAVIGIFYYLSVKFSINIPWFDDVENIPYFLVRYLEAPTWIDKWQAILRPNNEHRVLAARTIVLAQYYTTGGLNFRYLSLFGNLSVLALFGFIASGYIRQGGRWFMLVPVAFFIFNLQSFAGTFMTIMSMQYQMVILLSVASFYFLAKKSNSFLLIAIFIAFVDTFSMGNGMMVWPSGLVLLLFQVRWRDAVLWSVAAVIAIYFYFHGYDFVQGNDSAFGYILQHPISTFVAFFTMLGGDFDIFAGFVFSKRMIIPTIAGLVLVAIFVTWLIALFGASPFWRKWVPVKMAVALKNFSRAGDVNNRWNAFWLGTIIYVLISMLLVTVFRTRFDPHIILWSTYKMYPAVLTSVIYILVIQHFKANGRFLVFLIFLIVSGVAWLSTLVNYLPIVEQTSKERTAFAFNQKRNGVGLGATKNSAFEVMLAATLSKVDSLRIYSLPKPLIHPGEEKIRLSQALPGITPQVELNNTDANVLDILLVDNALGGDQKYIIMESNANFYLFAMNPKTLHTICPKGTIRAGEYSIGIWNVAGSEAKVLSTNQKVIIQ